MSRRSILVVLLATVAVLLATSVSARRAKVYRYQTKDGRIDYGSELPPGAHILGEMGEVDVPLLPGDVRLPSMAPLQSLRAHPLGLLAIGLGGVAWSIFLLRLTPRRLAGVELDWKDASVIAFHGFVGAALVVAVDRAVLPWLAGVIGARWPDAPEHLALDAFLWAVLLGAAALHQRSPVTYGRAMGVLSLWALLLSVSAALALGVAGSVSAAGGQLPG